MIDYNNTIIYKICCKDVKISDVYVGHTTDFVKRKQAHRYACENNQSQLKLYKFIREHGGWENWEMDIIAFEKCRDLEHAKQKEQEFFVSLAATLNSIEPFPDISKTKINATDKMYLKKYVKQDAIKPIIESESIYECKPLENISKYSCENFHNETDNKKNTTIRECKTCDFKCSRPTEMSRHLLTRKHQVSSSLNEKNTHLPYTCKKCNKEYSARNSLWYHEKKCKNETIHQPKCDIIPSDESIYTIVNKLISEDQDFKKFIIDQASEHKKAILDLITQTLVPVKGGVKGEP